eukprot:1150749-Pelagomonas_calceolata.AAC.6
MRMLECRTEAYNKLWQFGLRQVRTWITGLLRLKKPKLSCQSPGKWTVITEVSGDQARTSGCVFTACTFQGSTPPT